MQAPKQALRLATNQQTTKKNHRAIGDFFCAFLSSLTDIRPHRFYKDSLPGDSHVASLLRMTL